MLCFFIEFINIIEKYLCVLYRKIDDAFARDKY